MASSASSGLTIPLITKLPFHLIADGADAGGSEPTAKGFVHEEPEVLHREAGGDVGLERGELGDSGEQLGETTKFRTGAHLERRYEGSSSAGRISPLRISLGR